MELGVWTWIVTWKWNFWTCLLFCGSRSHFFNVKQSRHLIMLMEILMLSANQYQKCQKMWTKMTLFWFKSIFRSSLKAAPFCSFKLLYTWASIYLNMDPKWNILYMALNIVAKAAGWNKYVLSQLTRIHFSLHILYPFFLEMTDKCLSSFLSFLVKISDFLVQIYRSYRIQIYRSYRLVHGLRWLYRLVHGLTWAYFKQTKDKNIKN